jgi:acetylglutamate kinase
MTRVIKVGGRAQSETILPFALARLWMDAPRSFCLVHGGGDAVSKLQTQLGGAPRFVDGRRVTTDDDIQVLRMSLSGVANKHLVASLSTKGIDAAGISGEDGSLLVARAVDVAKLGRVGAITSVNDALLRTLLENGFLPVISPVSRDADSATGVALNVNADDAAAAIAGALGAEELLLISDVSGVMIDGVPMSSLSSEDAAEAVQRGIATDGMATKLRAALDALRLGVPQVRIGGIDALLDSSLGTTLVGAPQLA